MKNMNRFMAAGTIALLLGSFVPVYAHEMATSPEAQQKMIDEKVNKLTKELKLTSDQQANVRQAVQSKIERIAAIEGETHDKIRSVLNTEQTAKFDKEMMKKEK